MLSGEDGRLRRIGFLFGGGGASCDCRQAMKSRDCQCKDISPFDGVVGGVELCERSLMGDDCCVAGG